jgi:hypothetical protein
MKRCVAELVSLLMINFFVDSCHKGFSSSVNSCQMQQILSFAIEHSNKEAVLFQKLSDLRFILKIGED